MANPSLAVGVPTSGRPEAIKTNLSALDQVNSPIDELVVFDNSPSENADVPYMDYDARVIREEETVSPGEARRRIADSVDTDLLLLVDDDTIVQKNTIPTMIEQIRSSNARLVSGIWKQNEELDAHIGSIYKWGKSNGEDVLIDIPVDGKSLKSSGIKSITLDSGLPTILVETSIFEQVEFDDNYDFFYEWIDFFLQCHKSGLAVRIALNAEFDHRHFPYNGPTIRRTQERSDDYSRFCEKWGVDLERDLNATGGNSPNSLSRKAALVYARHGPHRLFRVAKSYLADKIRITK
jgi:GT2 family glycosyltransferase